MKIVEECSLRMVNAVKLRYSGLLIFIKNFSTWVGFFILIVHIIITFCFQDFFNG